MYRNFKKQLYLLLDPAEGEKVWDKVINSFIVALIVINVIAVILETVDSIYQPYRPWFDRLEVFSVVIFSIEYGLRVWTCTELEPYRHPVRGRLKYIFSFGALVDLIAILPFYLPWLLGFDLRFVRVLRIFRLFRVFKLTRYLNASKVVKGVLEAKKDELIIGMVMTLFLIVLASCTMYVVEHDAQPDKFSSIPETMWWSVATLTTVGYGDVFPITTLGKTLTAFISILGIGLFALPAGILASGFSDEFKKMKAGKSRCPHCGEEIE